MDLEAPRATMSVPTEDRRLAPRFAMRLPMRVKFFNDRTHEESTFTRDVSSSGVFFYLDGFFQNHPGEREGIEFTLTLPLTSALAQEIKVRYTAEVVRIETLPNGKLGVAVKTSKHEFVPAEA